MKKISIFYALAALFLLGACSNDDDDDNGIAPLTEQDAAFTFAPSADNPNIINFTASNPNLLLNWDLGNGRTAQGAQATGTYPLAGSYTVTLTANNALGSVTSSQVIVIERTDPTLLDREIFNLLTGGVDSVNGKTWVIDSLRAGHFGVGPNPATGGDFPQFFSAPALDKAGSGLYSGEYTFRLANFGFTQETNGLVYLKDDFEGRFPGAFDPGVGDRSAPFTAPTGMQWTIEEPEEGFPRLTLSQNGWIGFYVGSERVYEIIDLKENQLIIRTAQENQEDLFWYHTLIPAGFDSGGGDPVVVVKATLPLNFDTQSPTINSFEGNVATIIDNPDKSGLNTTDKVLQLEKGFQGFSGSLFDLENAVSVGASTTATLKVWAPQAGVFRFKIENSANNNQFVEADANVETAQTWVELTFNLPSETALSLDRIVLFPSWDVPNGGTFFVDQINVQ